MTDFENRLNEYLQTRGLSTHVEILTPDASTREYFRIDRNDSSAIACVYPEPFVASEQSYLDVTGLFRRNGLPVAEVYDFDEKLGVIVQEDLGNTILRDVLGNSDQAKRESLLNDAISLIARIQAATGDAITSGSIAGKLKFDVEKLVWELEFFRTHYFETFKKSPLSSVDVAALNSEFHDLAADLESRATVLCHRDFHAANLMLDKDGNIRIIDHQDARIGSSAYDLVSLLLDRVNEPPSTDWLAEKCRYFLEERVGLDLSAIDEAGFEYEFSLQTVQRCLKAVGTFSFQSVNRGKTYFIPFIKPMFAITLQAIEVVDRFPRLRDVIERELAG
jgi:aminoglycoside/choline kinase family phosphotransferase